MGLNDLEAGLSFDQSLVPGTDYGLGSARHAELAVNVAEMPLDRVAPDPEGGSNLPIGVSDRDQTQYLQLTCGQRFDHCFVIPLPREPCVILTKSIRLGLSTGR